ncbi:MAG TPA: hypothetical protein VNU71_00160 [Burkholderiaceae bacterium]|nr:hypothetical protein [Burkholderiaceae bacterium]
MSTASTIQPLGQGAATLVEHAADTASSAIRSTQTATNSALDRLSDKVDSAREQAAPLIERLTSQAGAAAQRGADAVRETSAQLRERALRAQDTTVGYIKDEPVKAMLIAAATGAALMALVSLMSRSRGVD